MKPLKYLCLLAALLMLGACSAPRNVAYFQDVKDGSEVNVPAPVPIKVQPGDKLRINVSTPDKELLSQFNIATGRMRGLEASNNDIDYKLGYMVESDGCIDMPMIGKIKAEGLTRQQISQLVTDSIESKRLLKQPIVTVDFINLGVSVLGDVKKPQRMDIPNDYFTILEALSTAGGLNITGNRTNIKVLREQTDEQMVYELNLLDAKTLYSSPAFYLQQNDVVYVEPNTVKKRESTINGSAPYRYSFWISLGSLLITVANLIWR